jgi:hypothetical protein
MLNEDNHDIVYYISFHRFSTQLNITMPRITSVNSRQLTVAAPDQTVERVIARLGPLPVATHSLGSNASVDEGSTLTVTVTTANVRNGIVLLWRILDRPEDFLVSTGTVTINSSTATFTVTPLADLLTEGSETFRIELIKPSGSRVAVSSPITINDTSAATLTVTPQALTVNEGDTITVVVTVDSQDIPDGFVLYWTSTSAADLVVNSGSFEINDNRGEFTVTFANDFLTEGTETLRILVRSGSETGAVIAESPAITVLDTSVETYAIQAAASTVNEGSTLTFTVTTQGVPNGTTLYWTVSRPEDFAISSGSFAINSNSGTFSVTPLADATTEGPETFTASVRTGSTSGTVRVTSSPVTITDTSQTPTYAVSAVSNSVDEGQSLNFTVTTTNVSNGTTLYWTVSRPEDFATSSGSFTINSNSGTFSVTPTADAATEGAETFTASVRTGSTSGTIVATSSTVTINDRSTNESVGPPPSQLNTTVAVFLTGFVPNSNYQLRIYRVDLDNPFPGFTGGDPLSGTFNSSGSATWGLTTSVIGTFRNEVFSQATGNTVVSQSVRVFPVVQIVVSFAFNSYTITWRGGPEGSTLTYSLSPPGGTQTQIFGANSTLSLSGNWIGTKPTYTLTYTYSSTGDTGTETF